MAAVFVNEALHITQIESEKEAALSGSYLHVTVIAQGGGCDLKRLQGKNWSRSFWICLSVAIIFPFILWSNEHSKFFLDPFTLFLFVLDAIDPFLALL